MPLPIFKGTRIQVAYKGDTIVYDASAFKLPEGSMLDGLIRQLPGAELKDNGDIYINGVKIDYLTLNGKDFFKGDNKVMLDNLPYFTVKNLKVFYKDTKKSEMLGRQVEEQDYVMDVTLKREYSRGYIANAEVGASCCRTLPPRLFPFRKTRLSACIAAAATVARKLPPYYQRTVTWSLNLIPVLMAGQKPANP